MTSRSALASGRAAILVVGVGRSGTSALTRVLNLLGGSMADVLLPDHPGNPRGHWEPKRFVDLNDEIIGVHTANWWDTRPIPPSWFASQQAAFFARRVADLFTAEYGPRPLPLIKDPRLCRVMPVYRAAFAQLGITPHVVLPLRHPAEVMQSIAARDSTDPRTNELIWIRHLLEAEFWTRECPRVWTRYDDLLTDWRALVARVAGVLGIVWPVAPEQAAADIDAFLEPSMRHFDERYVRSPVAVGPLAMRMWEVVQYGERGDEDALREGLDDIRAVVGELDRLSVPQADIQAAQIAVLEAEFAALTQEKETLRGSLAAAVERDAAMQARVAALDRDKADAAKEQDRLRGEIAERNAKQAEWADERARLQSALDAAEHRIAALLQSRSWRLTAPLRALRGG